VIAAAAVGLGALFVLWRSPRHVTQPQDPIEPQNPIEPLSTNPESHMHSSPLLEIST
jgi:hypothetical protein